MNRGRIHKASFILKFKINFFPYMIFLSSSNLSGILEKS